MPFTFEIVKEKVKEKVKELENITFGNKFIQYQKLTRINKISLYIKLYYLFLKIKQK